jgi:cation transport ATPase
MVVMKSIIHYWKLSLTIIIGIIALALFFRLHQPILAQWLVSIYAIFIAIILLIDMIKMLRSGSYGVDILAITAIIATIAVGQFWAALVIVLMLTGGETLEDFADHRAFDGDAGGGHTLDDGSHGKTRSTGRA